MKSIARRQAVGVLTDSKLDTAREYVTHFLAGMLNQTIAGHPWSHNMDIALQQAALLQMGDALQTDLAILVAFDETLHRPVSSTQHRLIGYPLLRCKCRHVATQ